MAQIYNDINQNKIEIEEKSIKKELSEDEFLKMRCLLSNDFE